MSFLPRQRVQAIAARSVWPEVSGATTTSTSSEAGTGLEKCIPTKRAGWASDAASSVTGRELVLVQDRCRADRLLGPRQNLGFEGHILR
jgi:hypothetical protein